MEHATANTVKHRRLNPTRHTRSSGTGTSAHWRRLSPSPARSRGRAGSRSRLLVAKRLGFHKPEVLCLLFLPFTTSTSPNLVIMSDPETEVLRSTFPSYMAEGERLYLCGEFSKAVLSFSNVSHSEPVTHHHFGFLNRGPDDAWRTLSFLLFTCS